MTAATFTHIARERVGIAAHADHAPAWPVREDVITFDNVTFESGAHLRSLRVAFRLEGTITSARDNVVVVVHALTGTTHATQWWGNVIYHGGAIDPARHAVLCASLYDRWDDPVTSNASPLISVRDQALLLARLLDALDVDMPLLIVGGSLGGMVALELAASFPERIRAAVVFAAPALQTAQGIAWNAIMRHAIHVAGPRDGLALARMVGMLSYRTPEGLEQRFGTTRDAPGDFRVAEWLSAHGERLVERFSAARYLSLIGAMDTHDVGRGRGGVRAALSHVGDRLVGVGIPGDQLYPANAVRDWTNASGATYRELVSAHGHDAFLLEGHSVSTILREAIANAT